MSKEMYSFRQLLQMFNPSRRSIHTQQAMTDGRSFSRVYPRQMVADALSHHSPS